MPLFLVLLACQGTTEKLESQPPESILDSVDTVCAQVFFLDDDGDGFGDPTQYTSACSPPDGYSANENDCNDQDASIHPGSPEVPRDGTDQDCDGSDACVDLNCDGFLDIVLSIESCGGPATCESRVYIGSNVGYTQIVRLETTGAYGNAIADLTNDGWPDVAFAGTGEVRIYIGGPDDALVSTQVLMAGEGRSLAPVDVDLDGFIDLVLADRAGPSKVFYGSASGLSEGDSGSIASFAALGVAVADLDSDGDNELIFTDQDGDTRIYPQESPRTFGEPSYLPALGATGVAAADIDQDGYVDVVVANSTDGDTADVPSYVFWGSAAGPSENNRTELPTRAAQGVTIADLDQDGYRDLIFSGGPDNAGATSHVYWGSTSRFSDGDHIELPVYGSVGNTVADLDNDGWKELVFGGNTAAEIFWGPSWPYNPSESLPDSAGATGISAIAMEQGL